MGEPARRLPGRTAATGRDRPRRRPPRSPDGRRRRAPARPPAARPRWRASCLALFVTPLGLGIVDYLRAYDEHIAPNRLPFEWQATHRHPVVLALVAAFALLAARLWATASRPRPPRPGADRRRVRALRPRPPPARWSGSAPLAFMLVHRLGPGGGGRPAAPVCRSARRGGLALLAGWWGLWVRRRTGHHR
ncbi:MAG: hypothetical protein WKF31_13140 [Thermoleophilaceae bacterium]